MANSGDQEIHQRELLGELRDSRWIISGACQLLAWNKAHVLGPLNGRHYAFDGIPVTIEWNEVHQSVASTG